MANTILTQSDRNRVANALTRIRECEATNPFSRQDWHLTRAANAKRILAEYGLNSRGGRI
jgi:hypothetical protein